MPNPKPEQETIKVGTNVVSVLAPPWQSSNLPGGAGMEQALGKAEAVAIYDAMLLRDSHAKQATAFFVNLVTSLIGEYSNEDEKIEAWVRTALRSMRGDYRPMLRWMLRAVVYGYSVMEKIWKQDVIEGRNSWVYDALLPVGWASIAYDGIRIERATGQPREIVQWAQFGEARATHIPGGKVTHWAYDDSGTGYGTPTGEAMRALYTGKADAMGMWLTGVKRLAQKLLYERIPDSTLRMGNQDSAQPRTYFDIVQEGWKTTLGGSVILRPVTDAMAALNLPSLQVIDASNFTAEFADYVDYVNRAYFLALGIPSLVVMESAHTAQAQSAVHSDAAKLVALPLAREFSEACLIRDLIRPLIILNFGEQADYGTFPCAAPLDEAALANLVTAMSGAGVLGLMIDERIYAKLQALVPELLPEIEGADYGQGLEEPVRTEAIGAGAAPAPGEAAQDQTEIDPQAGG